MNNDDREEFRRKEKERFNSEGMQAVRKFAKLAAVILLVLLYVYFTNGGFITP